MLQGEAISDLRQTAADLVRADPAVLRRKSVASRERQHSMDISPMGLNRQTSNEERTGKSKLSELQQLLLSGRVYGYGLGSKEWGKC
jgi:hypothetical protein